MSLLLIDGKNAVARGHFGWKDLQNSTGEPIGGIYGTVRLIRRLTQEYPGHLAIVVWDGGHADWRKRVIPGYKERSYELNDESKAAIAWQSAQLVRIFRALGIINVRVKGVEADDIIATLCKGSMMAKGDPIIFSTDKDFLSMVTGKAKLIRPKKGTWTVIGAQDMPAASGRLIKVQCQTYKQTIFVRAMIGDTSDNIKGVHRIGPGGAKKILDHITMRDPSIICPFGDQHALRVHAERYEKTSPFGRLLKGWDGYIAALQAMNLWRGDLLIDSEWQQVLRVMNATKTSLDIPTAISLYERYEFADDLNEWWRQNVTDFANRRSTWDDSLVRWSAPEERDHEYHVPKE